jgi:hypothetical protein
VVGGTRRRDGGSAVSLAVRVRNPGSPEQKSRLSETTGGFFYRQREPENRRSYVASPGGTSGSSGGTPGASGTYDDIFVNPLLCAY